MSKYVYPAILTREQSGLYSVAFPDFEACFTQGSDLADALTMAQDILSLTLCDMEDDGTLIPQASSPQSLTTESNSFVSLVMADTVEYRRAYSGRAVKKTLTLPSWLNYEAEKANVNFSQILQNALMEYLHIER